MYKGKVFEVKRNATYPITIHHYYYDFPYLDGAVKHGPSMPIQYQRESFWRLQGDILGSMVGGK